MMPGMNPRQMNKMMQKMGIKQDEIEASEVIIKTPEKNLIIKNPSVTKVDMMGQKTFQIIGEVTEESSISEEDINTVSEQANVSKEEAKKELEKTSGDLAEAIVNLSE
ncbi:nascent polypeptide-associated complex protein [Candidatus Woesearchaeota archaeon]|jgi:nascent polypeptide-associated complex subunit alpha|nr:nascent polypeptide-associated complex protein [Candidatus Woesearchaeota archaeon]